MLAFNSLIPQSASAEAKAKYLDKNAWRNFAQRITHHPDVQEYLHTREAGLCSHCKQPLNESVQIHHIDYDHYCSFGTMKIIATPTRKRLARSRSVPDCKACSQQRRELFDRCMSKLTVVHASCNAEISMLRLKGADNPFEPTPLSAAA
jgi:hypothetical protein